MATTTISVRYEKWGLSVESRMLSLRVFRDEIIKLSLRNSWRYRHWYAYFSRSEFFICLGTYSRLGSQIRKVSGQNMHWRDEIWFSEKWCPNARPSA